LLSAEQLRLRLQLLYSQAFLGLKALRLNLEKINVSPANRCRAFVTKVSSPLGRWGLENIYDDH
jgi:hypothetical protein